MISKRLADAMVAYEKAFNQPIPQPFGISDEYLAEELERAVKRGKPISWNFNWWKHLPPGANA